MSIDGEVSLGPHGLQIERSSLKAHGVTRDMSAGRWVTEP